MNSALSSLLQCSCTSFCRSICTEISSQNGVAVNRFNVKNLKQDEI